MTLFVGCLVATLAACSEGAPDDTGSGGTAGSSGTSPTGGGSGAGPSAGTSGSSGNGGSNATGGSAGVSSGGASGASGATAGAGAGGAGAGGAGSGGAGAGGAGSGGAGAGGDAGLGASSGTSGAGSGGASGSAGDAGGGGAAGSAGWTCPSGLTTTPTLTGTPVRIASVPPPDAFNMDNGNFGNIEGPVWIGDALYVSEMGYMPYDTQNQNVRMSRILKVTSDGTTTIHIADSGSNGLAVDAQGNIVAAVHKDGTLTRYPLPTGAPVPIASTFMSARFNSPNDLAIRSDGNIYFSDPPHQAPNTLPQPASLAYRVAPGGEITPIPNAQTPDQLGNPNGIALSLNEDFLYVAASVGRRYPVMADGSLGAGADFPAIAGGDGMVVDCAGNLYLARDQGVHVFSAEGTSIGTITVPELQSVTNVAFGGADRQTLYITGLGNQKGVFTLPMNLPGKPY